MPIGVIEDGGWDVGPKTADPVSVLAVLMVPAMGVPVGGTLIPISRPSEIDPNVPFVLPASCCVSAGGRIEVISRAQAAPLGSIERVARLLTRLPICTTTGMKHPVTPAGTVKRMTSQA